jgi:hypothetical protein
MQVMQAMQAMQAMQVIQAMQAKKGMTSFSRANRGVASAGAYRVRRRATVLGAMMLATAVLGGCCEDGKREMDALADKYNDQAFACCKAIAEVDPPGAVECFNSVKEWRLQTGQLIITWYQACLAGNRDLAAQVLATLRQLVNAEASDACGGTFDLPDGRHVTTGIPFAATDTIALNGAFTAPFGVLWPPETSPGGGAADRAIELHLDGGSVTLHAMGAFASGGLGGSLRLVPLDTHTYAIAAADLDWVFGSLRATMRLADPHGQSRLRLDGARATLDVRCALAMPQDLGVLAPPELWMHLPLEVTSTGLALQAGETPARTLFPISLGVSDWNGDGAVTTDDWIAYITTEPIDGLELRDLTLDGVFDAADVAAFMRRWRDRAPG